MRYTNPIIRGFNPDPSVCRVGRDYYLVTSSFAYFPGIPVYHSTDLVNWTCIGHCISRLGLLPYSEAESAGGIWAPAIRYYDGTFYVTATFSRHGNFILSAEDPAGPWSDPVWTQSKGIDPSMYFENGEMYYCTNDPGGSGEGITLCKMDVRSGSALGERVRIWGGTGGGWLEAPHIYKVGEYYYLLCAEGGTGLMHMVTAARSRNLFGPYEACPNNPILTNRNDTSKQVLCAGHADLFEDADGNWWCVHLACRPNINMHSNIGRETFLMPVSWADGWPRVLPDGMSRIIVDGSLNVVQGKPAPFRPDFYRAAWEKEWLFLRERMDAHYLRGDGSLLLYPSRDRLTDPQGQPTFACIRQTELAFEMKAEVCCQLENDGDEAGLAVYLDHDFCYRLAAGLQDGKPVLLLKKQIDDIAQSQPLCALDAAKPFTLSITADKRQYHFFLNHTLLAPASTRFLSTDIPDRCFTGTMLGVYADGHAVCRIHTLVYTPGTA